MKENFEPKSYGRLAFDMVSDVKKQLIVSQQKEEYAKKELYFKGKFNELSWQVEFKGLAGTYAQINLETQENTQRLVFNLNGINVCVSDSEKTSFNIAIQKNNILKITCSELTEQVFTLLIFGNVVDDRVKNKLLLFDNENSIDAVFFDEGYRHSVLTSPEEMFFENLQKTELLQEFLDANHRLTGSTVTYNDLCVLSKVDGFLKITKKSSQFATAYNIGNHDIADKACIVPILHSRYAYHIVCLKNNTLTSLFLATNHSITRSSTYATSAIYPIVDLGGCNYLRESSYLFNAFWYVDSNNDAYLIATKNYNRTSTAFSYHDTPFKLGKAEMVRIYINGYSVKCYLIYKNTVTVLTFEVSVSSALNFLQLISKEQFSSVDDGVFFRGEHLLKFREFFTKKPLKETTT